MTPHRALLQAWIEVFLEAVPEADRRLLAGLAVAPAETLAVLDGFSCQTLPALLAAWDADPEDAMREAIGALLAATAANPAEMAFLRMAIGEPIVAAAPVVDLAALDLFAAPASSTTEPAAARHAAVAPVVAILQAAERPLFTEDRRRDLIAEFRTLDASLWRRGWRLFRSLRRSVESALDVPVVAEGSVETELRDALDLALEVAEGCLDGKVSPRKSFSSLQGVFDTLRAALEDLLIAQQQVNAAERQQRLRELAEEQERAHAEWASSTGVPLTRIQSIFLREMAGHLQSMTRQMLLLESEPADREALNSLMRSSHSIKGSGAAARYRAIATLAHGMEDLMVVLRDNDLAMPMSAWQLTLRGVDVLQRLMGEAERGDDSPEAGVQPIAHVFARLSAHIADNLSSYRSAPATVEAPALELARAAVEMAQQAKPAQREETHVLLEISRLDGLLNQAADLMIHRNRMAGYIDEARRLFDELGQWRRLRRREQNVRGQRAARTASPTSASALDKVDGVFEQLVALNAEFEQRLAVLGRQANELHDAILRTRLIPIGQTLESFPRAVRDLAEMLGKSLQLQIAGGETALDKTVADQLAEPLLHLVRNAADHGIEAPDVRARRGKPPAGLIRIEARQLPNQVLVVVSDDGGGINVERVRQVAVDRGLMNADEAARADDAAIHAVLLRPGFSTAASVSDISGRGVGMDVVAQRLAALKGTLSLSSVAGRGTRVELRLPITLSITTVLPFDVGARTFGLSLDAVAEVHDLDSTTVHEFGGGSAMRFRGGLIPLIDLAALFGAPQCEATSGLSPSVLVVGDGTRHVGLVAGRLHAREQVVIKKLVGRLRRLPFTFGAAVMEDGHVLVLLDPSQLVAAGDAARSTILQTNAPLVGLAAQSAAQDKRQQRLKRARQHVLAGRRSHVGSIALAPARVPIHRTPDGAAPGADSPSPPDPPTPPPAASRKTPPKPPRARLLVVDDSPAIREFSASTLRSAGYSVTLAADPVQAFEILAEHDVDLILTDLEMPEMHGYEFITELKNTPHLRTLPIVILSGQMGEAHSRRGVELGANEFILKPCTEQQLLDAVARHLPPTRAGGVLP